ncbi:ion transporter [Flagellimonas marinaquae]|uniref:ion transporter n=1 Tax=Flagellimonas marinaquae TaxID=254955 RepID=UPI000F8DC60E
MIKQIREIVKVDGNHKISLFLDRLITVSIVIAIVHLTLETEKDFYKAHRSFFRVVEILLTIIFTVEYIMRLIAYNRQTDRSFLSHILSSSMLIDLMALIPFYLTLLPVDLRYLRIFRLFRIARIFKLARYNRAINIVRIVMKDRKELLTVSFF